MGFEAPQVGECSSHACPAYVAAMYTSDAPKGHDTTDLIIYTKFAMTKNRASGSHLARAG